MALHIFAMVCTMALLVTAIGAVVFVVWYHWWGY